MQVDDETVRNLQAEINWCKISLVAPNDYQRVCAATHRQPPAGLEPDQFTDVYQAYETEKTARGEIDFDDILLIACHVLESYDEASTRLLGPAATVCSTSPVNSARFRPISA